MNGVDAEHYSMRRGNQNRGRNRREGDALFDIFGLHTAEYKVVVGAMAYYRCYGVPPMRQDLDELGIKTEMAKLALQARFLEETPLRALRPTAKAWREMGESPQMKPSERQALLAEAVE